MNTKPALLVLALATSFLLNGCESKSTVSNGVTAKDITVNFKDPDKFTDVRDTMNGPTVPAYLDILSDHLKERAPAHLQAGQNLTVTFTDIDLAGDFQPGGARNDTFSVRLIKSIYRPRMVLNFEVRDASGKVVKEGQRTLQNLSFELDQPLTVATGNLPLSFDKLLLTRWLEDEFK